MGTTPESYDLQKLLATEKRTWLVNTAGEQIALSTLKNKCVALYFSAHCCPPCREFTPLLRKAYEELKAQQKPFEVVFFSNDRSQDGFQGLILSLSRFSSH